MIPFVPRRLSLGYMHKFIDGGIINFLFRLQKVQQSMLVLFLQSIISSNCEKHTAQTTIFQISVHVHYKGFHGILCTYGMWKWYNSPHKHLIIATLNYLSCNLTAENVKNSNRHLIQCSAVQCRAVLKLSLLVAVA